MPEPEFDSLVSVVESRQREVCWDLPCTVRAAGMARRLTREVLVRWDVRLPVDDVVLIVSELVANAVIHARPSIVLSLYTTGRFLRGEVADGGEVCPLSAFPSVAAGDERGRGLRIVAAYADRWGVDPAPGGKIVWFSVASRSSARRSAGAGTVVARGTAGVV